MVLMLYINVSIQYTGILLHSGSFTYHMSLSPTHDRQLGFPLRVITISATFIILEILVDQAKLMASTITLVRQRLFNIFREQAIREIHMDKLIMFEIKHLKAVQTASINCLLWIIVASIIVARLLSTRASEQDKVIGVVSIYIIYMYLLHTSPAHCTFSYDV